WGVWGEGGGGGGVLDDWGRAVAGEDLAGPGIRTAVPGPDVDATVAVADQRRQALLQRLVRATVDRGAVVTIDVGKAAVERGQKPPALPVGNRHRPAHGRVRRLVAPRVPGKSGQRVVEPGDVGDDARIVDLRPEGGDEHRRASIDEGTGPPPDPFPGQGVSEDGFDRPWPGHRGMLP